MASDVVVPDLFGPEQQFVVQCAHCGGGALISMAGLEDPAELERVRREMTDAKLTYCNSDGCVEAAIRAAGAVSNVIRVLKLVRRLLRDPKRWTRGTQARNQDGIRILPTARTATSWCLTGAIYKITQPDYFTAKKVQQALKAHLPPGHCSITALNDCAGGHREVMNLLRRTIAAEQAAAPKGGAR
jgi:hypothetical protein